MECGKKSDDGLVAAVNRLLAACVSESAILAFIEQHPTLGIGEDLWSPHLCNAVDLAAVNKHVWPLVVRHNRAVVAEELLHVHLEPVAAGPLLACAISAGSADVARVLGHVVGRRGDGCERSRLVFRARRVL
jgi:hypothetical protein